MSLFGKIVSKLKESKQFFDFSPDGKSLIVKVNFELKDAANKTVKPSVTKTYKPDDINITKKLDIEDHQIYKDYSSLNEI